MQIQITTVGRRIDMPSGGSVVVEHTTPPAGWNEPVRWWASYHTGDKQQHHGAAVSPAWTCITTRAVHASEEEALQALAARRPPQVCLPEEAMEAVRELLRTLPVTA